MPIPTRKWRRSEQPLPAPPLLDTSAPPAEPPALRQSFGQLLIEGATLFSDNGSNGGSSTNSWRSVTVGTVGNSGSNFEAMGTTDDRTMVVVVVLSGALVNFLGSMIFNLSPAWTASDRVGHIFADFWMTAVLAMGVFCLGAVGSGLSRSNRRAVARLPRSTLQLLLAPALLNIFATFLFLMALALTQPALVGLLEAATQLLMFKFGAKLMLRMRQSWTQSASLLVIAGGVVALCVNNLIPAASAAARGEELPESSLRAQLLASAGSSNRSIAVDHAVGETLACLAGVVGAVRNLVDAAVLAKGCRLPAGSLLLVESLFSMLILGTVGSFVWLAIVENVPSLDAEEDASLRNLRETLRQPVALLTLFGFAVAAYCYDASKLWLVQSGRLLRQRVFALLNPVGTWAISLTTFYVGGRQHRPALGTAWAMPSSAIELVCFAAILTATLVLARTMTARFAYESERPDAAGEVP
jgi:hypothetical protein